MYCTVGCVAAAESLIKIKYVAFVSIAATVAPEPLNLIIFLIGIILDLTIACWLDELAFNTNTLS